jgi:hypothetical protein
MFFYVALLIACVIIALVILYLYNSLVEVGRTIYRAFLPSAKTNFTTQPQDKNLATTINDTPTPWGWDSQAYSVTRKAKPKRANLKTTGKPWGW